MLVAKSMRKMKENEDHIHFNTSILHPFSLHFQIQLPTHQN